MWRFVHFNIDDNSLFQIAYCFFRKRAPYHFNMEMLKQMLVVYFIFYIGFSDQVEDRMTVFWKLDQKVGSRKVEGDMPLYPMEPKKLFVRFKIWKLENGCFV